LWYFPDGTASTVDTSTSPEAMPTDGWGSSAMLNALVEGLAGVRDRGTMFNHVDLTPRWIEAGEAVAEVELSYPVSGASFGYSFAHDVSSQTVSITVEGGAAAGRTNVSVLLPDGREAESASLNGSPCDVKTIRVGESSYADVGSCHGRSNRIRVTYK